MINYQLIAQSIPQLLSGARLTVCIAFASWVIGFVLGTLLGFLQASKVPFFSRLVAWYVGLIRGTPMLIHITFLYYVLPLLGITLSNLWVAIIAIGLNSGAYVSQIIRSGILAVGSDQWEAGRVLGLSSFQIARFIIFPQALRVVLPSLGGEMATLIKDSSLASVIGVMELYKESRSIVNQTYDVVSVFCIVALFYLVMTTVVALLVSLLEKKMGWYAQNSESHKNIS